ncbi:hypothetical protein V5799_012685 [Amblyomma americanum]|uniref:40s ribosomal protein s19 n=2 Tax=Amblyomma americanum TaxID=6943 RepID=A0AAQ4E854_AMBAM
MCRRASPPHASRELFILFIHTFVIPNSHCALTRFLSFPSASADEMPSVGVKDVEQQAFVRALSAFLKKSGKLKVPDWVDVVKTAIYKELAPYDEDWFYTRCASVARHLYMRSPSGVKSMRKIYGGRYRRGVRPSHFCPASASVARKALQALEQLKLVEQDPSGGRKLTSQGRKDLDRIAAQIKMKTTAPAK